MKKNRYLRPGLMLVLPLTLALLAAVFVAGNARAATLIHSYDFATGVTDSVGGQNGVLFNGAAVQGHALVTDGVNDYAEFASQIVPNSGSFSVAFWVNQASRSGTFTEIISQATSGGPGFYLGHNPSGVIRVTDTHTNTGVQFGALNTWMQFTLSVDPTAGTKLYRDGGLIFSAAGGLNTGSAGSPTRLARQLGTFNENFSGAIDDVKIYTGALSAAEAQTLYANGRSVGVVPEPGTWALWALGLGLVGWARTAQSTVRRSATQA